MVVCCPAPAARGNYVCALVPGAGGCGHGAGIGCFRRALVFSLLERLHAYGEISKAWHHCAAAFVVGDDHIACGCQTGASLTTRSGKDQKRQSIQRTGKDSIFLVVPFVASQAWFCWDLVAAAPWAVAVLVFDRGRPR